MPGLCRCDILSERDKLEALHCRLRISPGLFFFNNPEPIEIEQRDGQRRNPTFDLWRFADQIQSTQTSCPVSPLCEHVNEHIDVNQNLHPVKLRVICSRIRILSSSIGFSGWIPTSAKRSGSIAM